MYHITSTHYDVSSVFRGAQAQLLRHDVTMQYSHRNQGMFLSYHLESQFWEEHRKILSHRSMDLLSQEMNNFLRSCLDRRWNWTLQTVAIRLTIKHHAEGK